MTLITHLNRVHSIDSKNLLPLFACLIKLQISIMQFIFCAKALIHLVEKQRGKQLFGISLSIFFLLHFSFCCKFFFCFIEIAFCSKREKRGKRKIYKNNNVNVNISIENKQTTALLTAYAYKLRICCMNGNLGEKYVYKSPLKSFPFFSVWEKTLYVH